MNQKIPPLASKQLEPLLIPISDIKPHPDNYKIHPPEQLRSLKASLKTFSWTTPIKANLEGFIIAGHGMYQAALEEGYTHVPVEFCALDKRLSKAYLVADNETSRKAETDSDKLALLLQDAAEIPDFDMEAVGFSSEDIDSLLDPDQFPIFNLSEDGTGRYQQGEEPQNGGFSQEYNNGQIPTSFKEYDETIQTEHRCPKCGYEWSGASK